MRRNGKKETGTETVDLRPLQCAAAICCRVFVVVAIGTVANKEKVFLSLNKSVCVGNLDRSVEQNSMFLDVKHTKQQLLTVSYAFCQAVNVYLCCTGTLRPGACVSVHGRDTTFPLLYEQAARA